MPLLANGVLGRVVGLDATDAPDANPDANKGDDGAPEPGMTGLGGVDTGKGEEGAIRDPYGNAVAVEPIQTRRPNPETRGTEPSQGGQPYCRPAAAVSTPRRRRREHSDDGQEGIEELLGHSSHGLAGWELGA